jgi:hypothetical protein
VIEKEIGRRQKIEMYREIEAQKRAKAAKQREIEKRVE